MKYLKLFESYDDLINKADDIAAYVPTETSSINIRWMPFTYDPKDILKESDYQKLSDKKRKGYFKYYTFGFDNISYLYDCEDDIIRRSKSYGFGPIFINLKQRVENRCIVMLFKISDYKNINMDKFIKKFNDSGVDVLFENDIHMDTSEFDIIYDDNISMVVKPKTYKAAIRYSSDTKWKSAFKSNQEWIEKYLKKGSYYGGINWYSKNKIVSDVETWWTKLLGLSPKRIEKEVKEFVKDFPRYLMYIVIQKNVPSDDPMRKTFLLYDISRDEYGAEVNLGSDWFSGKYGEWLDSAHNQVIIHNAEDKRVTLRDIWDRHRSYFSNALAAIDEDLNKDKDRLYDLLGFWADKGGSYTKKPLSFVRNNKGNLLITRPDRLEKTKDGHMINPIGDYSDPTFDYWDDDEKDIEEREIPTMTWDGYFKSIRDNVKRMQAGLEALGGDIDKPLNGSLDGIKF